MAFRHNNQVADDEPNWGSVDKTALPRIAFADMGEEDKKSTWGFPHHWVKGGTEKDENGVWTNGTLYLHRGGLNAAWAAAQGARSGEKASTAVISHLKAHRAALGITSTIPDENLVTLTGSLRTLRLARRKNAVTHSPPKIVMEAYTGAPVVQSWSRSPIVLDVNGIEQWREDAVPIVFNHDPDEIVGHATIKSRDGGRLICEGRLSGKPELVEMILRSYENGFPWSVSVGADIREYREVQENEAVVVNGRNINGPCILVTKSSLIHVALVGEPADPNTTAFIAAGAAPVINVTETASPSSCSKEKNMTAVQPNKAVPDPLAISQKCIEAEKQLTELFAALDTPGEKQIEYRTQFIKEAESLRDQAIAQEWSPEKVDVELLRLRQKTLEQIIVGQRPTVRTASRQAKSDGHEAKIIECAIARAAGVRIEKHYSPEICEQSERRPLSLGQLLIEAAVANGMDRCHRIDAGNIRNVLIYAFSAPRQVNAAWSYADVDTILSNVANKLLMDGFQSVEQAWRRISAVRPLNDLKTTTVCRLTDNLVYEEVPSGGEITHGTLTEESFTIVPKTYARMVALRRQDIINDDLGALQDMQRRLGRGAGLKLNSVFWAAFLNNSTFFTSARGNLSSSTSLSLSNLGTAIKKFRELTDGAGHPVGVQPRILLVPPALEATALNIYQSPEIRDTSSSTRIGTANVYRGQFEPVVSAYIGATIGGTSGFDTTWYLLADPQDIPVMMVGFLNGKDAPTVESAQADFNVLGIQFRGYFDFGVSLAEYRAGVKCTAS